MRVHTDHARATFRALPWTARQPARGESVDDPAAVLERASGKSLLTMPLGGRVVEPGEREPARFRGRPACRRTGSRRGARPRASRRPGSRPGRAALRPGPGPRHRKRAAWARCSALEEARLCAAVQRRASTTARVASSQSGADSQYVIVRKASDHLRCRARAAGAAASPAGAPRHRVCGWADDRAVGGRAPLSPPGEAARRGHPCAPTIDIRPGAMIGGPIGML